jgi:ABC-type Zn uptake system ZnuABC Zn-binding protein ZnuA
MCLAGLGMAFWTVGCSRAPDVWEGKGGPPRVVVSFPPLYSFVKSVAGDRNVGVICLCTTTGPHHYVYTSKDAMTLKRADLFFANGLNLDDAFTDQALTSSGNPNLKAVTKLGDLIARDVDEKKLPEDYLMYGACHHHHGDEGHDHPGHEHELEIDPHMWLGIPQAVVMVQTIRDQLKAVDPAGAADYDANAEAYIARLKKLQEEGRAMMPPRKPRIVTFHESLNYFADSFGLKIIDVIRKSPGTDPTNKEFADLVERSIINKIRFIAVEPQYPKEGPAVALVNEMKKKGYTDVEVIEIDPLETADESELSAEWYEKKMRENLENIKRHLP